MVDVMTGAGLVARSRTSASDDVLRPQPASTAATQVSVMMAIS
jgi:hypothetical protein